MKKIVIQSLNENIPLELEIDMANVIQNNYSQEIETPNGKAKLDLKDLAFNLSCPFCKESHQYSLRSLVNTDRLDWGPLLSNLR